MKLITCILNKNENISVVYQGCEMMSQVINSRCQAKKNERYSVFCIHTDTDSLSIVDYILSVDMQIS